MTLEEVAIIWGGWKHHAELFLGLTPDGMHVHVGVVLMLVVALVTRRRMDHWSPWLAVLIFECLNEFIDMNQSEGSIESNWTESLHDLFNTMFLPTAIMIYARIKRFEKVGAWG